MVTVPVLNDHDTGILANLRGGGRSIGELEAPATNGVTQSPPYAFFTPIDAESDGPGLADPDADVIYVFQVTCVGETREMAQRLRDELEARVLNQTITITNRSIGDRSIRARGGADKQDTKEGPRVWISTRYAIRTTPS